jgi:hypothetical protein
VTNRQAWLLWLLGSAGLMVLGGFGPWATVMGMSVNGTQGDGWAVIAGGVVGAGVAIASTQARGLWRFAGVGPLLGGIAGAVVALHDRHSLTVGLAHQGAFAQALAQVGWGLNLAAFASLSLAVCGALMLLRDNRWSQRPAADATSQGSASDALSASLKGSGDSQAA